MMHRARAIIVSIALCTAGAALVTSCRSPWRESPRDRAALARPDRSWVRLDGTVVRTQQDSFELDFGDGVVTVEMDDWDWVKEASPIRTNDKVVVYGRIDSDLHRRKAVEAAGVYVEGLGTTFFASAADEEAVGLWPRTRVELGTIALQGRIEALAPRSVVLQTGAAGKVTVDVSELGYDPLDDEGFQQLEVGDRIRVIGRVDSAYFAAGRVVAQHVVRIQQLKPSPS